MSIKVVRAILNYPINDPVWKVVMVAIADHADVETLVAWPAISTVAERSGACVRTVRRKVRMAEEIGLIETDLRDNMSSQYRFRKSFVDKYRAMAKRDSVPFAHGSKEVDPKKIEPELFNDTPVNDDTPPANVSHTPPASDDTPPASDDTPPVTAPAKQQEEQQEEQPILTLVGLDENSASENLDDYVVRRWNEIASKHAGVAKTRKLDPANSKKIGTLAKDNRQAGESLIDVWEACFAAIERSDFLLGLVPPRGDRAKAFRLSLIWTLSTHNFAKIVNGAYDGKHDAEGRTIDSVKPRGATAVAADRVRERFSSGRSAGVGF